MKGYRKYLLIAHFFLGVLLLFGGVGKYLSIILIGVAALHIVNTKNKNNEALFWAGYMVGSEVLYRMTGGLIFYELPKYSVILLLGLGLIVEKRTHHISISYIFYLFLLIIGIAFIDIPYNETIRKAIAFNLSGPFLLGLSAVYCYNRRMKLKSLFDLLFVILLPIISMAVYLYFRTPSIQEIAFSANSNFAASGGYGPNQVSTMLGLGGFIVGVFILNKRSLTPYKFLDFFLFAYFLYRGLMTMSRGGLLTAVIAMFVVLFFYTIYKKVAPSVIFSYFMGFFLIGAVLFVFTDERTGGMLTNRYTNKNSMGIQKQDISTGRAELFMEEFNGFIENPFFGLGVGGAKFYRLETMNIYAASHNELSRLFAEHGMLAFFILFILIGVPTMHILKQPLQYWGILGSFLIFWFLTINHSSMRIAFPGFIYGLSLLYLYEDEETDLHRE